MKNKSMNWGGQTHLQFAVGDFGFGERRVVFEVGGGIDNLNPPHEVEKERVVKELNDFLDQVNPDDIQNVLDDINKNDMRGDIDPVIMRNWNQFQNDYKSLSRNPNNFPEVRLAKDLYTLRSVLSQIENFKPNNSFFNEMSGKLDAIYNQYSENYYQRLGQENGIENKFQDIQINDFSKEEIQLRSEINQLCQKLRDLNKREDVQADIAKMSAEQKKEWGSLINADRLIRTDESLVLGKEIDAANNDPHFRLLGMNQVLTNTKLFLNQLKINSIGTATQGLYSNPELKFFEAETHSKYLIKTVEKFIKLKESKEAALNDLKKKIERNA